jgi:acetyltransferase-like isoleucine patch superfamily enzyme
LGQVEGKEMGDYRGLVERIGEGTSIADGVEIIRSGSKYLNQGMVIGDHCLIHSGSRLILGTLDDNPHTDLIIGDFVQINWGCYLSGEGGLEIGDRVLIGPCVCILSAGHGYFDDKKLIQEQGLTYGRIVIEEDVWIGGGSVILEGVRLGRGCVIGGGSTIVKDVPPYAVVAGNPGRVIKWRGKRGKGWVRFFKEARCSHRRD